MQRSYVIAAMCSLFIHILIILCLFNYVYIANQKPVGYKNIVQAYVMPEPIIISKRRGVIYHVQQNPAVKPRDDGLCRGVIYHAQRDDNQQRKSGNPEQLLIILHNQIQQQINNNNYELPEALNKKSAEIRFLLTSTGEISDINIIQSSGMIFLDNLAIQAVKDINPCNAARKYLNTKSYFKIKVYYNAH